LYTLVDQQIGYVRFPARLFGGSVLSFLRRIQLSFVLPTLDGVTAMPRELHAGLCHALGLF